jgi:RNA polymerase sigma-70 factor (ECF subfamily)
MGINTSEMQLQSRLRNDDKSALEFIYVTYKEAFFNYALRFDISKRNISDIYQDSIIAMYQNFILNQVILEKSTIKTYLFGIGKHKIYKHLKDKKRTSYTLPKSEDFEEIRLEDNIPTLQQKQLAHNLNLISDSCQHLLKLFYYRGLSIDDIVDVTDYKDSNTVRSHKSRCVKRLKSLFKVS